MPILSPLLNTDYKYAWKTRYYIILGSGLFLFYLHVYIYIIGELAGILDIHVQVY